MAASHSTRASGASEAEMLYAYYAATLYVAAIAVYIVTENRSPKSTFAWMFLFLTLPVAGIVIYMLFGRETKAFSRTDDLIRHDLPGHLRITLAAFETQHAQAVTAMKAERFPRTRLIELVRSSAHSLVTTQNRVEVLQNAEETYPRLIEDLKAARSSIHLQYYSWASDAFGDKMKAILTAKAAEGVEVRVLYDPVGSFRMLSWRYIRAMRAGGVEMLPFSRLWRLHTISYRNHRKIAVIDGRIGFTGGLNIGGEHLDPGNGFGIWRDTHLRVVGSGALALQAVFAVDWSNASAEQLLDPRYFPEVTGEAAEAFLPMQMCLSGPDSQWNAIRQLYFAMILGARERVLLTSPFFVLDETVADALKAAALGGVDVRIMLSARGPGQYVPYWAANTYAEEVAEAGAKVFLYDGGYLHAKTICIDGNACAIGSANWDIRSFSINYELNAVIYDRATAAQIEAAFERDLRDCHSFDPQEYRNGSRVRRFRDSAARLASPLL